MALDTSNKHMVGVRGGRIIILSPPRGEMTKEEAIMLAAWIVTLADDDDVLFQQALKALREI